MQEEIYALWLKDMEGMTPRRCYAFFQYYGSFKGVFEASLVSMNHVLVTKVKIGKGKLISHRVYETHHEHLNRYEEYFHNLKKAFYILTPSDEKFPQKLLEVEDCPIVLCCRGNSIPSFGIGIVGARRSSLYGKDVAMKLAKDLSLEGVNIISGLAYGIDVAAHQGALNCGGFTTAVLGGGVSRCYPKQHQKVFDEIIDRGCVLSEELYETPVEPYMFPKRNRIISGLSYGVLVVEAANKSGSLITADFALEQGRDVFAVPGRILDPKAKGTNQLIKQGAKAVFDYDDILSEYVHIMQKKEKKSDKIEKKLEEKEKIVYSCIGYEPVHEEILLKHVFEEIRKCTLTPDYASIYNKADLSVLLTMNESDVILCLLTLELKGLIIKKSGCYYARSEV